MVNTTINRNGFETLNLVLDFISNFLTILNVISTNHINVNKIREK